MKAEVWNGHQIRFIQKDGEWWAVLKDLCNVLGLNDKKVRAQLKYADKRVLSRYPLKDANGRTQMYSIVKEQGVYRTIFQSRKPSAKEFQIWVMDLLVELRKQTGLQGFEVFQMLDKEHQKEAMQKLKEGLKPNGKVSYIKANTIANKAVSNRHGYDKMVKKKDMTPGMLRDRQAILDDTVELMTVNEKFGLNLSVAEEVYKRWDA